MTSAVCPPRSPFTVTGRSPQFWSRPLGPPVSVFPSFYLRDLQHEFDGILSLGPFVAAGSRIG